jgi:hypothetical protein
VELREPQTDRMQRVLAVAVTLIVAIAVMALYLRMSERRGAPACVEAYAAARTAAETAFVDVQRSGGCCRSPGRGVQCQLRKVAATRQAPMRSSKCVERRLPPNPRMQPTGREGAEAGAGGTLR